MATIVPTYIDAQSFSVPGDLTAEFHTNRKIKLYGGTEVVGTVLSSAYTTVTTVTLTTDSPTIYDNLTEVKYGFMSAIDSSLPVHDHKSENAGGIILISEDYLKLDSGPTNDYVLTADSSKSGGMKWSSPASASLIIPTSEPETLVNGSMWLA